MSETNNNTNLDGTESRILMAALLSSNMNAPVDIVLALYMKLAQLSNVQPPPQQGN